MRYMVVIKSQNTPERPQYPTALTGLTLEDVTSLRPPDSSWQSLDLNSGS